MRTFERARRMMNAARPIGDRVAIGYPHGGNITDPFARSLDRLRTRHRGLTVHSAQGLYISKNRNELVRAFLRGRQDYLLQIDTDIEFQPEAVTRLLEIAGEGRDIVAANVRLGSATHAGYARSGEFLFRPMETLPPGDVVPVDAAATAMMLIHRRVFEALAEKAGPCWFNLLSIPYQSTDPNAPWGGKEWEEIGEDLAFCQRAAAAGFQAYLARGLGLKHHKRQALEEMTA